MPIDLVRVNMQKIATVEATLSMEMLFALIGEIHSLSIFLPTLSAWVGIVMIGMIAHSYFTSRLVQKTYKR